MNDHAMLDDVALYVLGVLPSSQATQVRAHLATCEECRQEYALLAPAASVVGLVAEDKSVAGAACARAKDAIMQRVRREAVSPMRPSGTKAARTLVWPAYLVAAACLVLALISGISNLALVGQLHDAKAQLARTTARTSTLARNLADERTTLSDVMNVDAKHFATSDGEVIARGGRLYIALHDLPEPPHGKVYQAWTLPKNGKTMQPSVTFVPDARGVAVIALPVDARATADVAVSVEPEGGSKAPTSKPIFVVSLS